MKISGISHGTASVVAMILGAALVEYIKNFFPIIFNFLESIAKTLTSTIYKYTSIRIPSFFFVPLFVVFVLSFFWGSLYHFIRHGKSIK